MNKINKWINKLLGTDQLSEVNRQECLEKARYAEQEVFHILEGRRELQAIGIAPCREGYAVRVNLTSPLPEEVEQMLPRRVEGVPIKTEVVGQAFVY